MGENNDLTAIKVLRKVVATLAYRATRTIEGAPEGFGEFSAGEGVMTPRELITHLAVMLGFWSARLAGSQYDQVEPGDWPTEVDRFYAALKGFDGGLAAEPPADSDVLLRLLQGPMLDSLTHVGQLAMLRRLAGSPVLAEHYGKAQVEIGRVGRDQPAPFHS